MLLLLSGCGSRPELPARSAAVPVGADLSGRWELQGLNEETNSRLVEPDQGIYVPPAGSIRRDQMPERSARTKRSKGPLVHLFIENGRALKISQTAHGLFVSFDRSVVEEYTFGENRVVSLGPIEAQRVSGWDGLRYIVETMDDRGTVLTETWSLKDAGSELVREIKILDGEKELYSSRQVFDRS